MQLCMLIRIQSWFFTGIGFYNEKYVGFHLSRGRLGNQLFHLVTGYGIARTLGRKHYFPNEGHKSHVLNYLQQITNVFPRLKDTYVFAPVSVNQTVVRFANSCCVYENPLRLWNNNARYLLLDFYFGQNPRYFVNYMSEIRKLLQFSNNYRREGNYMVDLLRMNYSNLMCIHIRRTDFVGINVATDMKSTVDAANNIARQRGLSKFLIFGDDKNFMHKMSLSIIKKGNWSEDAVIVSKFNEYMDLYVSSQLCRSFLISAATSTFGWWLAFFAYGQDAVYYMPDERIQVDKVPDGELFLKTWQLYKG
ncbi:hypothetical protein Aduo_011088 [Ancylostoma duodenale]